MTDPGRLLEEGATQAERALLHSAGADRPPPGAAERAMDALAALTAGGVPGSGQEPSVPGGPAPAAAPAAKLGVLAKAGLAALVGVGVLGAGVLVQRMAGPRVVPGETPSARAPNVSPAPVPAAAGLPTDDSLSAEIRILDVARAAVDARDPAAAQRALASYAERFPQGHLQPEATVLRLAVLVQQGSRAAARSLAAELLASKQYEAYQYRIRSLLREARE